MVFVIILALFLLDASRGKHMNHFSEILCLRDPWQMILKLLSLEKPNSGIRFMIVYALFSMWLCA